MTSTTVIEAFLAEPRNVIVAGVRKDGRPHVSPNWYFWDGEKFYEIHRERHFYNDLVSFMSSGPVVVIALEKENAVADYRALIGATDPAEAAEGTVRKRFAASKGENAVHGSDSVENGRNEIAFFFAETDIVG